MVFFDACRTLDLCNQPAVGGRLENIDTDQDIVVFESGLEDWPCCVLFHERPRGRDCGGEIRFHLNHDACTMKPTGDLADEMTGVKSRLGARIDFGHLGPMT